jgi:iron complex outermembrane receptor protein
MPAGQRLTKTRSRAPGVAKLVALACFGNAFGAPALAAESVSSPVQIDLAPGPLQQALDKLADLTHLQILYDPDILRGLTTAGLHGKLTPAKALEDLLAATGIAFEFTAQDAVALREKARAGAAPEAVHPVVVPGQANTVIISTDRNKDNGYDSAATLGSTKIDESSLLVPFSAASLSQQVLRDQQPSRLDDVIEFVSGAEVVPDGQSASGFEIRGFPTYQYYLDGVRVSPDLHHDGFRDLADIDSVEILKGPASLLYGRTEPGGLINVITKQPLATPLLCLEQQAGSFGRTGTSLDAGGPLSSGGSFLYRFNAAWESGGSFRDVPDNRRLLLSPVVTWKSSSQTQTTAYLEYLNSHDPSDSGLPVVGSLPPPVPVSRSVEEGGEIHTSDLRVGVRGLHAFEDQWTLTHHEDARWIQAPQAPQLALAADGLEAIQCTPTTCPVARELVSIPVSRGYTYYASVDLARDLSLWHTQHTLLIGTDFFQAESYSQFEAANGFDLTTDLYHPEAVPIPLSLFDDPHEVTYRNVHERWGAVYIQDQASFLDRFYLLLGLRFDKAWTGIGQSIVTPATSNLPSVYEISNSQVHALTKRIGFVWHPTTALSLYAKYAENFGAVPGLYVAATGSTGLFAPTQTAAEYETGVKLELADGRAAATLAAFDLKKNNVSSSLLEPALDPAGDLYLTGSARNRGLELEIHGEIVPGAQLLANYAYTQSKINNFTPSPYDSLGSYSEQIGYTGNRLFGVPRNGGSVWGSYRFADPVLQGLKLGVGVIARGARAGDNVNDYQLPGFTKWNTLAAYTWRAWGTQMSAQVNVDNVFNTRYFESISGTKTVMPGAPRRWLGSFKMDLFDPATEPH